MSQYGALPRARRDGLLEETLGEELLLYDQESHAAHCLSPIAACVWRHCDGEYDLAELAVLAGVSEDLVADALHELREKDLLDAEPELMQSTVPGESRREAIVRVGRYGAGTAAVPLVVSAVAATPAMASSGEEAEEEKFPPCKNKKGWKTTCCVCQNKKCTETTKNATECEEYCQKNFKEKFLTYTNEAKCP
jgi:hypothetical protein